jgi:hypothetical protein
MEIDGLRNKTIDASPATKAPAVTLIKVRSIQISHLLDNLSSEGRKPGISIQVGATISAGKDVHTIGGGVWASCCAMEAANGNEAKTPEFEPPQVRCMSRLLITLLYLVGMCESCLKKCVA